MSQAGFCNRWMSGQIEVSHSVIDRPMQHLQAIGKVDEHLRSGRQCQTTPRDDKLNSMVCQEKLFRYISMHS